jgi:hypothetical protein
LQIDIPSAQYTPAPTYVNGEQILVPASESYVQTASEVHPPPSHNPPVGIVAAQAPQEGAMGCRPSGDAPIAQLVLVHCEPTMHELPLPSLPGVVNAHVGSVGGMQGEARVAAEQVAISEAVTPIPGRASKASQSVRKRGRRRVTSDDGSGNEHA